jgi:sarcosine oxidase delta subunit
LATAGDVEDQQQQTVCGCHLFIAVRRDVVSEQLIEPYPLRYG